MDNLPRTLLLGYHFCERTGAILDPHAGTLFITDLKETMPFLRMKAEQLSEMVYTTFGVSSSPPRLFPNLCWQITFPSQNLPITCILCTSKSFFTHS